MTSDLRSHVWKIFRRHRVCVTHFFQNRCKCDPTAAGDGLGDGWVTLFLVSPPASRRVNKSSFNKGL